MARFYATFDNSTVSALEALSGKNYYQRLAMTNGATLKSALISARDALSSAMYTDLSAVNENGLLGVTVPTNASGTSYTISGGLFFGTTVYKNTQAVWQLDPRDVRTSVTTVNKITVANSTAVSPADDYSFSSTLYTNATTAVQNVLNAIAAPSGFTGNGPYARIGLNSFRTLASIWTDHALTYIAWDDYTPGRPSTVTTNSPTSQSASSDLIVPINWSFTSGAYTADRAGTAGIGATLTSTTGGNTTSLSIDRPATNLSYSWTVPGGTLPPGLYDLTLSVTFKDPTIVSHEGQSRTGDVASYIQLT